MISERMHGAKRSASPALLAGVLFLAPAARAADSTESTQVALGAIFFDPAMASLHPVGSPWSLLFGQQTLNYGLLSTRFINDSEILPAVELSLPGVTAAYAWNASTAGVGIAILQTEIGADGDRIDPANSHAHLKHRNGTVKETI